MFQVKALAGSVPSSVSVASPLKEMTSPAWNEAAVLRRQDRRRRRVADGDGQRRRERRVDAVGDREPRRVLAGLRRRCASGWRRSRSRRRRRSTRRSAAGPRDRWSRRSRRSPSSGAGPEVGLAEAAATGAWLDDVADAADLADAERAADVRVAEVDVVERAVGAFGQIDDVAVRPIDRAVGRLEVEDAADVSAGVERQAPDPVLRVVGEEVAALVAARELAAVVDEPAGDGGVAAVVGVGVERARAGRRAGPLVFGPAVVGARGADVRPPPWPSSCRCRRRRR